MSALSELFQDIADGIREKTGGTGKIAPANFPSEIRAIAPGGSGADVRYVTFMSHDGTVEIGKKAVAVGDNCANPIERGIFSTPTRESDAQYNYSFVGWATEPNGAWDETAMNGVTQDRTVYAAYAKAVRYYTVTYYDSDGSVLKTEELGYGSMPSYTPVKTGSTFNGWQPEPSVVTGDASYTAEWLGKADFNATSWADIAAYAASGEAETLFDLGATKRTYRKNKSGTTTYLYATIVGFNHDVQSNGTKAGITLMLEWDKSSGAIWHTGAEENRNELTWKDCTYRETVVNLYINNVSQNYQLESDLYSRLKTVTKRTYNLKTGEYEETTDKAFLPSCKELGMDGYAYDEGTPYAFFANGGNRACPYYGSTLKLPYLTRSKTGASTGQIYYVDSSGNILTCSQNSSSYGKTVFFVCI